MSLLIIFMMKNTKMQITDINNELPASIANLAGLFA